MKYRYKAITCVDIENKLGLKRGDVKEVCFDRMEITTNVELTAKQLVKLNKQFPNCQRDYSEVPLQDGEVRDLEAEIEELKTSIAILKKK